MAVSDELTGGEVARALERAGAKPVVVRTPEPDDGPTRRAGITAVATELVPRPTDARLAAAFKALGDVTRLRLFRILTDSPEESVSTIAAILDLSLPLTSQHIKALAQAQLLTKNRTGKKIFSRLDRKNPVVRELIRAVSQAMRSKELIPKI